MKKLLVFALATIGMVACFSEDVVELPTSDTIRFADAFINNSTRADQAADPSTTKETLAAFDVWAYMTSLSGTVLVDEDVELVSGGWDYTNTQYWTPNKNYFFAALAPMNSANWDLDASQAVFNGGAGLVTFTNVDGSEDLLYATAKATTPDMATLQNKGMETVKFQFKHLLSKVKFTFKNGFLTDNATVKVENIKMSAPKSGSINLGTGYKWVLDNASEDYAFGHAGEIAMGDDQQCDRERLTIPADDTYTYNIDFDVTLYYGAEEAYTVHKQSVVTGVALEMGKAYNFVAEITPDNLNLLPIVFEVVGVDSWVDPYVDVPVDYYYDQASNTYSVATAEGIEEIVAGINAGELPADTNVALSKDIDLNDISRSRAGENNWTPLGTQANPFTGTFNGNGYTIKNLVIDGGSQSNIGFFGVTMNGEIKDVTFENAKVSGRLNVGVVAGTPYTSKYTNITVNGHVEVDGMAYVGAVGGKNAYANWTNVTVNVDDTSYVNANSVENGTAYRTYVGGVVGFNGEGGHTFSNIYSNINVKGSTCDVGGLFGIAHYSNNFVNCVCEGDVEIYAASEEAEAQEIGGIAGVWHNENGTKVTFTNCSFTGALKANNDYVINTEKFGNLVCSSYNNTGKGILVIDGIEYSLVDGNVVINGCTPVSTADELVAALEANEGVYLMNDIKIDPASMSNAYGATGINIKNGQTIDGGGHTLNIQGAGGTWDSGINTTGGIIRNITVTGSFRGIFINHNSTYSEKVVLENVTLTGVVYTISCDQGLYQGIEATNCTFNGWTSFANTAGEAKFVNCYFGEGNGYKYCRPYSNTEFVNCTFCAGYAVDQTRATVTFTDCIWE